MKPYVNNPNWPNRKLDGYGPRLETGTVPGAANDYTIELDQRIVPNGTLTVTVGGDALTIVPWAVVPAPGQVAVSYDLPLIKCHSSRAGQAITVGYTGGGGVLSSGQMASVARTDAANVWAETQTMQGIVVLGSASIGGTLKVDGAYVMLYGDPIPAGALDGTVPVANLPTQVARRDQANTFTQAQTFNGGVRVAWKLSTASGASTPVTVATTDYFLSYSCINAAWGIQYTLPNAATCSGQLFVFQCRNSGPAGTITVQDATGKPIVGGSGSPSTYTLPNVFNKAVWMLSVGDGWQVIAD